MSLKTCTNCQRQLPEVIAHFYAHKGGRNGLDSACRDCRNAQRNAWKQQRRDTLNARRRSHYRATYGDRQRALELTRHQIFPLRVTAENLVSGIRERSRAAGWDRPAALRHKQFFMDWLLRQPRCPCCGVEFHLGPKRGGKFTDASPSVDRFNPRLPYLLDNIDLLCWRCNNIKRDYAAADLRRVAAWMDSWGNEVGKFGAVA